MKLLNAIACIGSVIGALLVAMGIPVLAGVAHAIWCVTNLLLAWRNCQIGEMDQAAMFIVYWGIAGVGVIRWFYG